MAYSAGGHFMSRRKWTWLCAAFPACLLLTASALRAQDINVLVPPNPNPLYLKWFREYQAQTGTNVIYQTPGSNRRPFLDRIDFSIAEVPMYDAEYRGNGPGTLNLPVAAHAAAIVYNLPGLTARLHLTGLIIADIYLGRITRWNDPQIAKINPGLTLPDLAIDPIHQSNGSGTTYVFTAYLSAVSSDWKSGVGGGKQVHWPVGLGAKRDVGMARAVPATPGSIGYLEFSDAVTTPLSVAAVQNADGKFVVPSVESMEAAANAVKLPRDMRGSIVNSPAPAGYPVVGYFYVFADEKYTGANAKTLITWMLTKGQVKSAMFSYAPLPPAVEKQALAALISRGK